MKPLIRIMALFLLSITLIACEDKGSVDEVEPKERTEQDDQQGDTGDKDKEENHQEPDNEKTTEADELEKEQTGGVIESGKGGFLWRIENGDTTVYLQGTVHLGTEDFYPFHEKIEQAYEEADVVVPEVDITEADLLASMGSTVMNGMYMDGTSIEDHISEDLYTKLEEKFSEYNISMEIVGSFKPWMLESLVTQLVAEELNYMHGVDMYFLERAKKDHKEIVELETVAEQLDVLSGQSDRFQEQQLEATLDSIDEFESMMSELFAVYLDGDEDVLLDLLFPEDEETDEEYEAYMVALNDDRNVTMAEKIKGFLEEDTSKTYFVIVGAAHLVMDPHIRTLLEEEGYEIERVY